MTEIIRTDIGYDDGDVDTNRSTGPSLNDLIDQRYSRRDTLRSGVGAMAMAVFGSTVLAACDDDDDADTGNPAPTVTATASPTTATAGTLVTVTGTATDDGSVTATTFTQVSGPIVTLSATTGTTTSFVAPAAGGATSVAIRFAATDNSGNTSSADAIVSISPAVLSFTAVPHSKDDVVKVPSGYTVGVLYRTGDPITADTPAYRNDGTDTNFANRAGDHHDAMHWFGLASDGTRDDQSSTRGLLATNHENINQDYLHVNGATAPGGVRPESEAIKEIEAHGVSVVEVTQTSAGWGYVQASSFNFRVTPNTPMAINGPARGSTLLQTAFSADGTQGRGTLNNCANGYTQWGTLLTCEENWAGYFRRPAAADNPRRSAKEVTALTRYGVTSSSGNFGWATVTPADSSSTLYRRFDAQATGGSATADYRNEPNQFGWVVEIDPYDKTRTPRKRTALGRMNHEGCWPSPFVAGVKPAFYMGDDARNEYLYKFVSATAWVAADASNADRLSIGDKYLDTGTLYVAQFKADGTGTWLPLTHGTAPLTSANTTYPFADQADVLTHARLAGDALAATKMDRPEWTAVNPVTGEVYLTLTNNSARTPANADAANPRAYLDPPNSRLGNHNGHIVRLRETNSSSEATTFTWDIYLFGAGQDLDPANINVSGLTSDNDFSSPDGCWFSRNANVAGQITPLLWIQTDDGAYTDVTNCMMLAAIPGIVGDGGDAANKTIVNTNTDGTTVSIATKVGKAPGTSLKRFLVGPLEAEITGVDTTPDGRTMFVNIQHPGEEGNPSDITSHWPATQATGTDATNSRPRSATIVIQRTDGGIIGL
ncbi:alkaline phosphatase PhoX [Sphingomonas sp. DT-204]|uniref:PhoX family protein n=1 Tax=Sphingomonas sp. DT-204 TaxID=3396166 RepID=UPI003F1C66EF